MKALTAVMMAALVSASALAAAAEPESDAAREQRMSEALDNYRSGQDASPGPAARAEESVKRGLHKTGQAIERGAKKVGHAIGTGMHKAGDAIGSTGEKLQSKTTEK